MYNKPNLIDISRHQGKINWSCMAKQGVIWAAMRATICAYYKDPLYRYNAEQAKANGIMRPPYHVTRADRYILGKDNSAQAQMDYFAEAIEGLHDGVVVLDVELAHAYGTTRPLPKSQVTKLNLACWEIALKRYDAVYFYTRASFMNDFMEYDERFRSLDLFNADYGIDDGNDHGLRHIAKGTDRSQVVIQQITGRGDPFCVESKALDYDVIRNQARFLEMHKNDPLLVEEEEEEEEENDKGLLEKFNALESRVTSIEERLDNANVDLKL
jgi:GH25 family lysozyme M1 (1,4-beta-N-acetylmuramidase)